MSYLKHFFTVFLFLVIGKLVAQNNEINFRQVSPPGGFSFRAIYSIREDALGYIWMGTSQGLIKYDSKNISWFIPQPNDSLSLPSETINGICIDISNNLWVGTDNGLCLFNRENQSFRRIKYHYEDGSSPTSIIRSIANDGNGIIWVADDNCFGKLDLKTNSLIRVGGKQTLQPRLVYVDKFNEVWLGTNNGEVFKVNRESNTIQKIVSAYGQNIQAIYTENDRIWVGYNVGGANLFDAKGQLIKHYTYTKEPDHNLDHGNVRAIHKDTYGRLWIASYEGLFLEEGNELKRLDPDHYPGLPHNSIFEIFEDQKGGIWIGTWSGGVAYMHHADNRFQNYRHSRESNSLSNNIVSSFIQETPNKLLIGTEGGGLNGLDQETGLFGMISLSKTEKVLNVKALNKDKFGGIWVGTFQRGLWYRPPGKSEFTFFTIGPEDGKHVSHNNIYSICPVDSGVWIGTYGGGVNFYSFRTKSIQFCFRNNPNNIDLSGLLVRRIYADSKKNLWVGTLNGLFRINLTTKQVEQLDLFKDFNSGQSNNTVYDITELSSGDIWIGPKISGVKIYHPQTGLYETFDANGLLAGKDVYGIVEDLNRKVWVSSSNGLIVCDLKTKSSRQFNNIDGVQSNLFNPPAAYKSPDNTLYFGGTNGFTRFYPGKIKMNEREPVTRINKVTSNLNRARFPQNISAQELTPVTLSPDEGTFRVDFSSDNYLLPEKTKYRYRLVNYYDQWVEANNEGSVIFTGLGSGKYVFEVIACNNDGIWSGKPTTIPIIIQSHWYQTTVAYLVYSLFICVLALVLGRAYLERLKLKRAVLVEKLQRENEEQVHEMKLKFFTNISHEFRTPLTLITWPLKSLIDSPNLTTQQKDNLNVIQRNSSRLLQLINQLMDLRKLEKGQDKFTISKVDLVAFIADCKQSFSAEAEAKNIQFVFDSPFDSLEIEADQEKLDKIIFNLLSNAFKYIPKERKISISIQKNKSIASGNYMNQLSFGRLEVGNYVEIAVEDTGLGIDSEDLLKVFNRFEQGKTRDDETLGKVSGSGIGLAICKEYTLLHNGVITAQSTPGMGSRFTIRLPLKQKAQKILIDGHQEVKNLNSWEAPTEVSIRKRSNEEQKRILVVEDNVDLQKIIHDFLSAHYVVEVASDGVEGLRVLKHTQFDLVISDVMMPGMDGFEFCKQIKSQIETSHIPVIILTALSSSENMMTGLDRGADAFVTKPFDDMLLLSQIENLFQQRERIKENFTSQFVNNKTIESGSLDNYFMNRVRKAVEKNLNNESFSIESLAEELNISRSQLHRKITSLSGVSSTEFVNMIRVQKAAYMLKSQQFTIDEIAFKVGFNSHSYFTKCFKKVYKISPKEYVKG